MRDCEECSGSGQVDCDNCDSDNEVRCSECYGEERTACSTCEGARYESCPECDGSGEVTCSECDGDGYVDGDDDEESGCDCESCRPTPVDPVRRVRRGYAPLESLTRSPAGVMVRDPAGDTPDNAYEPDAAMWCRSSAHGYTCMARKGHRGNHEGYYMSGSMSVEEWTPTGVRVRGDHRTGDRSYDQYGKPRKTR